MKTLISQDLTSRLQQEYNSILQFLIERNYKIQDLPLKNTFKQDCGDVYTLAYPIQGILKYHGIANPKHRIPYFPSISLNNSCGYTVSYLKFDKDLKEDKVILNGEPALKAELERVKFTLDFIRNYSKINTKAILISRNFLKNTSKDVIGKGLGTSASGSSALALAAATIIYNNDESYVNNKRLISIFSRYLASSGSRSAVGGFSLLLSHPNIDPFDSYAIRLDRKEHQSFLENISILTIPIQSELKTHQAHEIAPKSPFFPTWLKQRKNLIFEFCNALENSDLHKIGKLAEYDTLCLHSVIMSVKDNNIIAWDPNTLKIMHKVRDLRKNQGYTVYFSIDTGPSVVLLTYENEKKEIIHELKNIIPEYAIIEGKIGGPTKIIPSNSPESMKLKGDIEKFNKF
ncbi:MAG: diphosphomevalonate/mevalonate 3,5-bisphosphate decarboxylase family protein [Candidatus Hermodarchaeota archaeon]